MAPLGPRGGNEASGAGSGAFSPSVKRPGRWRGAEEDASRFLPPTSDTVGTGLVCASKSPDKTRVFIVRPG